MTSSNFTSNSLRSLPLSLSLSLSLSLRAGSSDFEVQNSRDRDLTFAVWRNSNGRDLRSANVRIFRAILGRALGRVLAIVNELISTPFDHHYRERIPSHALPFKYLSVPSWK